MTKHDHWHSSQTQIFWTCKALMEGRILSTKTEIREVEGWRLAAVTYRLRKEYGWPILVEYRGADNIAHYRLAPGTDVSRLKFPPSAKALAEGGAA